MVSLLKTGADSYNTLGVTDEDRYSSLVRRCRCHAAPGPVSALPRAFLLDLDDTILDDSSGLIGCWRDACHAHQSRMNSLDAEVVFEAIDRIREWYWSDPERHRAGRPELARARGG